MAYETLINSSLVRPMHKPNYTPAKSFKKILKVVGKFFSTKRRHQQLNESTISTNLSMPNDFDDQLSEEECDNYANECREAAESVLR